MSEINNINASNRYPSVDKALSSAAGQKTASQGKAGAATDSVQISGAPDLSKIEAAVEAEFTAMRANLEQSVDSSAYPPLEAIDRLARMFAIKEPLE
jgi:hypothetical protein